MQETIDPVASPGQKNFLAFPRYRNSRRMFILWSGPVSDIGNDLRFRDPRPEPLSASSREFFLATDEVVLR
jgi:hypothetical protein